MTSDDVQALHEELRNHKELLAVAEIEIAALRDKVELCAATILESIKANDAQEEEILILKNRISELEAMIAHSDEQGKEAAQIFEAMWDAMDRMQETIKKVTENAKKSAAAADLGEYLQELEEVAKLPDEEELIRPPFARGE